MTRWLRRTHVRARPARALRHRRARRAAGPAPQGGRRAAGASELSTSGSPPPASTPTHRPSPRRRPARRAGRNALPRAAPGCLAGAGPRAATRGSRGSKAPRPSLPQLRFPATRPLTFSDHHLRDRLAPAPAVYRPGARELYASSGPDGERCDGSAHLIVQPPCRRLRRSSQNRGRTIDGHASRTYRPQQHRRDPGREGFVQHSCRGDQESRPHRDALGRRAVHRVRAHRRGLREAARRLRRGLVARQAGSTRSTQVPRRLRSDHVVRRGSARLGPVAEGRGAELLRRRTAPSR